MLIDAAELLLSRDQVVATLGDHDSTNTVDFGPAAGNLNAEKPLTAVVVVREAVASDGPATVRFRLVGADDAAFADPATLWDSGAIEAAALKLGYRLVGEVADRAQVKRYAKLVYTVAEAPLLAGKFMAWVGASDAVEDVRMHGAPSFPMG